jgi:hypothetical protein
MNGMTGSEPPPGFGLGGLFLSYVLCRSLPCDTFSLSDVFLKILNQKILFLVYSVISRKKIKQKKTCTLYPMCSAVLSLMIAFFSLMFSSKY